MISMPPPFDPRWMGVALVAALAVSEIAFRLCRARAAQPASGRGTAMVLSGCYGLTLLALLWLEPPLALCSPVAWAGVLVGVCGLVLRIWSNAVPPRNRISDAAACTGPYRIVRHPGYLGNLTFWCGAAMTSGNLVALLTVGVAMLASYVVRISSDESPGGANPDAPHHKSWRLIPFVY